MPYGDLDDFKAQHSLGSEFLDDAIERELQTASDDINLATGQRFDLTDEETRYFRVDYRSRYVDIRPPVAVVTSVHVDRDDDGTYGEDWDLNTQYVLEPLNAEADGKPWRFLRLRGDRYSFPDVSYGAANVKIVGQFGWLAVPSMIVSATYLLAIRYLKRAEAPFAMIPGEGAAAMIARTDPDAYRLIRPFILKSEVA